MDSLPGALELEETLYREITSHCKTGNEFFRNEDYQAAVAEYNLAWKLIPHPRNEWRASTWVLAAIADCCFLLGKNKSAWQALEYAMTCPGGLGTPFLHLRFGQVLFEEGKLDLAADELMRAYMGGAEDIFEGEDPKYFAFLKTRAII